MSDFQEFPKIARLSREVVITEKIDGTNAQVFVTADADRPEGVAPTADLLEERLVIYSGSRNRWITPNDDNFGFAAWVREHAKELALLGPGRHFGEWWGSGIQRGYGLPKGEKRFSLFNVQRWHLHGTKPHVWKQHERAQQPPHMSQELPPCVGLVPVLWRGDFDTARVETVLEMLRKLGSYASPGFMQPEGIVVFHTAAQVGFKKTLERDEVPKTRR